MRTLLTLRCLDLTASLLHASQANSQGQPQPSATNSNPNSASYVLKVQSDLVLTNVVVRDKHTGAVVRGLPRRTSRCSRTESRRRSTRSIFRASTRPSRLNEATVSGKAGQLVLGKGTGTGVVTGDELRNHRLVMLFFDLTSMQPDDLTRSVEAAKNYINRQMQAADLVAGGVAGCIDQRGPGLHREQAGAA